MQQHGVHPVILSGGAGTRLWPMSRTLRPKQLWPLVSERTMFQETVQRVAGDGFARPLIVCNAEHRFMVAEQLRLLAIEPKIIVLEPVGRNTAPAIAIAALYLERTDPSALMLVLPSDHVVQDEAGFRASVDIAAAAARHGALVTFGITPARPETGYGYIRRGLPLDGVPGCWRVDRFVEKPEPETAREYVASGAYCWNSGMFLLPVASLIEEMGRLEPDLLAGCRQALDQAQIDLDFLRLPDDPFRALKSVSVDYAVMERTERAAMVPVDIGWSDVGSWSALWEIANKDEVGNAVSGDVIVVDVHDCYIRGESNLIAVLGVRDLIIVATDDALLVAAKDRAQDVREIVRALERSNRSEQRVHKLVGRPWGWYRGIDVGHRYQVKQILVEPGHRLSSQMHHHRAEHWIVVSGTARVVRGDEVFFLTENESTYIPHNVRHSLENPGRVPLRLIEVQTGSYLAEDDIVRFDDHYGRVEPGSA